MTRAPLFASSTAELVAGGLFTVLLLAAAVSDVRARRVPNRLVGLLAACGLVYATVSADAPLRGLLTGLAGLGVGLGLWLPFYALRWLGAGDVKLFAAAGAWLGPARAVEGAVLAAIVGGMFAVAWMIRAYGVQGTAATASLALAAPGRITNHPVDKHHRRALPYGVALTIGAAIVAWYPRLVEGLVYGHGR